MGASGRVLAADIDVSWSDAAAGGVLEVRRHDVIRDPPPSETFDLVHARLVLVHLEDRATALRVMIDSLRPSSTGLQLMIAMGPDPRPPDVASGSSTQSAGRRLAGENEVCRAVRGNTSQT